MSCISEISFSLVNYFIFKNFQIKARIFENEIWFSVTRINNIQSNSLTHKKICNWQFQSLT